MKSLDFQTWSKTTTDQLPLIESNSNKVYDLESWITEGKLLSLDSNTFKSSSLKELIEMGLVEQ